MTCRKHSGSPSNPLTLLCLNEEQKSTLLEVFVANLYTCKSHSFLLCYVLYVGLHGRNPLNSSERFGLFTDVPEEMATFAVTII